MRVDQKIELFVTKVEKVDVETENMDASVPKNTYQTIHRKNDLYETLCVLCNQKHQYLVPHYTRDHPEHEVYISRPSPTAADRLRMQQEIFYVHGNNKIKGWCYFCEKNHDKKN